MWYDTFDGDLFKLYPLAEKVIGKLGDVALFTHGSYWKDTRTLGHPSTWNSYHGSVAFFGFQTPAKPASYWTDNPIVACTFEQALRDAWVHNYIIYVQQQPIWNGFEMRNTMQKLLFDTRGIFKLDPAEKDAFLLQVDTSILHACWRFDTVAQKYGVLPKEVEPRANALPQ